MAPTSQHGHMACEMAFITTASVGACKRNTCFLQNVLSQESQLTTVTSSQFTARSRTPRMQVSNPSPPSM